MARTILLIYSASTVDTRNSGLMFSLCYSGWDVLMSTIMRTTIVMVMPSRRKVKGLKFNLQKFLENGGRWKPYGENFNMDKVIRHHKFYQYAQPFGTKGSDAG
jgi:hypothetical protein